MTTESKFKIEVDEDTTLRRNDTVAHVEYGPKKEQAKTKAWIEGDDD